MTMRLIALCLSLPLLPTQAAAQQTPYPGNCDYERTCPEGQTLDSATKTCVAVSS